MLYSLAAYHREREVMPVSSNQFLRCGTFLTANGKTSDDIDPVRKV